MLRRRFLALTAGACSVLAAPRVLRGQTQTSVKIAAGVTPPSIHNIFLHVAYERGLFRSSGINVTEFIQLRGGPLAMHAVASGRVDVAPGDPEGVLAAVANGYPVRAVSAPGARLSYMVAVRKEIESIADLRGKPFAISRPGAISQYLMYPLLDSAGVQRDSVQWYGVGGGYERMLALLTGRVKGALLNIDFAMEAINDPNIKIIKSMAEILPEYPVELLVLRNNMLDKRPDAATAITTAIIQACRYIVDNKSGTIEVAHKYIPGMNTAVLERAYDELLRIRGFGVNGGMTQANLKIAYDLALQNHQIDHPIPLDKWADFRFQQRSLETLGLISR
jgi:ABC-type nitrate/sulfonate/bicarbonate transport system substrate-binding protein